jgi:hypothetical protein
MLAKMFANKNNIIPREIATLRKLVETATSSSETEEQA